MTELESLLEASSTTPEAQWRAQTLIRSAQEADQDICTKLYHYETVFVGDKPNKSSRARTACRKMHRDFSRVHDQLSIILEKYRLQRHVDLSLLTAKQDDTREEEEFFDRAMRERQGEVHQIHDSMRRVNEIYEVSSLCIKNQGSLNSTF